MCTRCDAKTREMRELAQRFRAAARETNLPEFVAMMTRTAIELEELADARERLGRGQSPVPGSTVEIPTGFDIHQCGSQPEG